MNILVLNCGSSTVKFQIIDTNAAAIERDADRRLAHGKVERIGEVGLVSFQAGGRTPIALETAVSDHQSAIHLILDWALSEKSSVQGVRCAGDIHAVGHRVSHGGESFCESIRIDRDVLRGIEACVDLAPLHNPANLNGIRAAKELFGPDTPQVAVFDTAFHATIPAHAYLYGIPFEYYERHNIRRYGFHGTSHLYVTQAYQRINALQQDKVNVISLHLGSGCSATAIRNGRSYDNSMGFTPLEGLVMGTRCGDVDPSVVLHLMREESMTAKALNQMLNRESGLLGISGLTSDMRELVAAEEKNDRARLAVDLFCYRVRKYIGAYFAAMGGADAVIFTGGIGECSPVIRSRICEGLECIGLRLDTELNVQLASGKAGKITCDESTTQAYVIPTNEELLIARDTFAVLQRP